MLALARVLSGVMSGGYAIARQTFVAEAVPKRFRGRAMSTLGGTTRASSIVGPLVGGLLHSALGVRAAFGAAALLGEAHRDERVLLGRAADSPYCGTLWCTGGLVPPTAVQ